MSGPYTQEKGDIDIFPDVRFSIPNGQTIISVTCGTCFINGDKALEMRSSYVGNSCAQDGKSLLSFMNCG